MPICPFDSRDSRYKSRFGAARAGEAVRFGLLLPRESRCSAAFFVIHRDDRAQCLYHAMEWSGMEGADGEWWSFWYTPESAGLFWYHFEYDTPWGRCRVAYDRAGRGAVSGQDRAWQLTVYRSGFSTPDWLKGGLIYQIFPDRFACSGERKEDVPSDRVLRRDWGGQPGWQPDAQGKIRNNDYFGGDLKGITQRLDYLVSLGVTCLYLNPIFEAHENHRYNTADYCKIDPLLGVQADFTELCAAAELRGISVVLDGVFSHTGADSVYFNREHRYPSAGASNTKASPYYPWYKFHTWPDDYTAWWGIDTLPEVEEDCPEFIEFITGENGVLRRWLRAGARGWRLDVADELPDRFLDALRTAVKEEKPEALVLGEVWEDASNKCSYGRRRHYLLGGQLDSVMNYPFAEAILHYIGTGNADGFSDKILQILEHYPQPVIPVLMNHIGTHDTPRAITALAGDSGEGRDRAWQSGHSLSSEQRARGLRLMRMASLLQYTLPGVPSLYYGDEIGMEGYGDPFNRACFDWQNGDRVLLEWYRALGKLRRACPALADGAFVPVSSGLGCVAYARRNASGGLLAIVNHNEHDMEFVFPSEWCGASRVIGHTPQFQSIYLEPLTCAAVGYGGWCDRYSFGAEQEKK